MRIGLLAYSSNTGLGYQTLEFYNHIVTEKVLVADLSKLNGMPVYHDRFPNARISDGIPTDADMEWLTDGVDMIFVCETPLNFELFNIARRKGVKTAVQYNYEFLSYFRNPNLPKPDLLLSPSFWEVKKVEEAGFAPVQYLPVPVNTDIFRYRKLEKADTLIHIMGRIADHDRNGTEIFLESIAYFPSDIKFKIYAQKPTEASRTEKFRDIEDKIQRIQAVIGDRLQVIYDVENPADMYKDGEVVVIPRRYGGLCLPMWEALATGLPVVMPAISPNDIILPYWWVVDAEKQEEVLQTHSPIPMYRADVQDLVKTVRTILNRIEDAQESASFLGESMSWDVQVYNYMETFQDLCNG